MATNQLTDGMVGSQSPVQERFRLTQPRVTVGKLSVAPWMAILAGFILTGIVYLPGLSGPFILDDFHNIVNNPLTHLKELSLEEVSRVTFSGRAGPLKRPIPVLSFGLNYYFHGLNPRWFKLTNLLIHLGCFVVVCGLMHAILRTGSVRNDEAAPDVPLWPLACFFAAIWALHPLNLSGVLYVVQRMTSMSALFLMLAVWFWISLRLRQNLDLRSALGGLLIFGGLAVLSVLCKENGVLTVPLVLVIELFLLRGYGLDSRVQKQLLSLFFILFLVVPLSLVLLFLIGQPDYISSGYAQRTFSMLERVLSELRILWSYLFWTVLPDIRAMGLYHDDFVFSRGLFFPSSTFFALVGHIVLLSAMWRLRLLLPWFSFAIAWFYAAHCLESTFYPLELVFEHRNYIAIPGVLLGLGMTLWQLSSRLGGRWLVMAFGVLFFFAVGASTLIRASEWGDPYLHHLREFQNHPTSPRANYELGSYLINHVGLNGPNSNAIYERAMHLFRGAVLADANNISGLVAILRVNDMVGQPVDERVAELLRTRLSTGSFAPSNINFLTEWVNACEADPCKFSGDFFLSLYEASLKNPRMTTFVRLKLLNSYGALVFNTKKDIARSAAAFLEVLRLDPKDIKALRQMAILAMAAKQFDASHRYLVALEAADVLNTQSKEIRVLKDQLAVRRARLIPGQSQDANANTD